MAHSSTRLASREALYFGCLNKEKYSKKHSISSTGTLKKNKEQPLEGSYKNLLPETEKSIFWRPYVLDKFTRFIGERHPFVRSLLSYFVLSPFSLSIRIPFFVGLKRKYWYECGYIEQIHCTLGSVQTPYLSCAIPSST